MTIKQMAAQAREHWKVTNPEIYRQMVEDNALEGESEAAAKLTMREMQTLMMGGMSQREAWQESRHLFIFKTAEQIAKSYQPERDENGKVIQPEWQRDSAQLPKKTSTPIKSILGKLTSAAQKEMLSGKNVPKKTPKQFSENVRLSSLEQTMLDWSEAIHKSNRDLGLKPRDKK